VSLPSACSASWISSIQQPAQPARVGERRQAHVDVGAQRRVVVAGLSDLVVDDGQAFFQPGLFAGEDLDAERPSRWASGSRSCWSWMWRSRRRLRHHRRRADRTDRPALHPAATRQTLILTITQPFGRTPSSPGRRPSTTKRGQN
jgi:hypothetical protein